MSQCDVCVSVYDFVKLHSPHAAAHFYVKRSSHECLQEQEEAQWNRKESNVWERGGYLLPFDLLWRELECVL